MSGRPHSARGLAPTMIDVSPSVALCDGFRPLRYMRAGPQPRLDMYEAMDKVLLLSCSGQVVYSGPAGATMGDHFALLGHRLPPASVLHLVDHVLDVIK